ncbi:hypothetical protein CYMTET_43257 [Cymbomonas tetramitiformis]|uniref:Uncharacterized protein n=1 Tax=Cymbomonas tetramitiformis TaxID=36881 RepID=A0AAE0F0F8_9CHLO|nr:hypothetical protein CYMTET_43257 [Cymbomonas tetramitiformis]
MPDQTRRRGIALGCIGVLSLMPFVDEGSIPSVFKVITLYNLGATINNFLVAGVSPPTVIHAVLLAGCAGCTALTL